MSFFRRIFSRQYGNTAGARDTESWQAGDWAECVHMGQWYRLPEGTPSSGPRHGRIGRVTGVRVLRVDFLGQVLGLSFEGWPGEWFDASGFRKVNPRADEAVAAESEFTELVRRAPRPALPEPAPAPAIPEFQ